jgi:hypothetical protein
VNYRLPGVGAVPLEQPPSTETSADSAELCECGHAHADHDKVAARYCAATIAGSLTRGCLCAASRAA